MPIHTRNSIVSEPHPEAASSKELRQNAHESFFAPSRSWQLAPFLQMGTLHAV